MCYVRCKTKDLKLIRSGEVVGELYPEHQEDGKQDSVTPDRMRSKAVCMVRYKQMK